jgi:hypothetical protein
VHLQNRLTTHNMDSRLCDIARPSFTLGYSW